MLPVDELLHSYYNKYVTVHEQLTINNQKIAKDFVRKFCHYLQEEKGLNVGYKTQGSAFEGINIGTPDEFDFLLVILESDAGSFSADDPIMVRYDKMKVSNTAAVSSYSPIRLGSNALKNPEFRTFQEKMPGTNSDIFSTQQTVRRFQTYINAYVQTIRLNKINGVKKVHFSSIDNPALTTVLERGDGTKISIDMTVCAKLNETTYITKRKDISGLVGKDREAMDMMWMDSYSLEEKEEITKRRSANQIKNYRIAKAILREKLPNSYIMKIIFLREENHERLVKPQTPYEFLSYMIDSLKQGYGAELERRNGSATNRNNKLLLGRFNQNENVLAKFGNEEIKNLHSYFESLNQSRLKDGNKLLEDLLGEKLTALKQKKGINISVPIARFGNYDGDDYDCCG